jgi:hypothetical protein
MTSLSPVGGVPPGVAVWVMTRLKLRETTAEPDRIRLGLGCANRFKTRTKCYTKSPVLRLRVQKSELPRANLSPRQHGFLKRDTTTIQSRHGSPSLFRWPW